MMQKPGEDLEIPQISVPLPHVPGMGQLPSISQLGRPPTSGLPPLPPHPDDELISVPSEETKRVEKRKRDGETGDEPPKKRAKRCETRGLSYFTKCVVEKLQNRRKSTFAEIANEIVSEYCCENSGGGVVQLEKNVRRRVYDALNVLVALDYIDKNRKEISWSGKEVNYDSRVARLYGEKKRVEGQVEDRKRHLQELERQQHAIRKLIERNQLQGFDQTVSEGNRVEVPFVVVHTEKNTGVELQMDESNMECFVNFDAPFEVHDDNEILKRMFFKNVYPSQYPVAGLEVNLNVNPDMDDRIFPQGGINMPVPSSQLQVATVTEPVERNLANFPMPELSLSLQPPEFEEINNPTGPAVPQIIPVPLAVPSMPEPPTRNQPRQLSPPTLPELTPAPDMSEIPRLPLKKPDE